LLEAAGEPTYEGMQGQSLWNVLVDEDTEYKYRDEVYCEHYNANFKHGENIAYATMIRTKQFKLVAYHGEKTGELYDLDTNPNESVNVWNNPEYQTTKLELYQRLCDRMAETVDPLPKRQSPW
jgi:arylsulfatase